MNIMLVGQKSFAVAVFDALFKDGHEFAAIWTPRDDRLEDRAVEQEIPVVRSAAEAAIFMDARPAPIVDVIINAHGHDKIPVGVRNRAKHGAIGYHPSLLPRHRGRDAIQWTIEMRDSIAGGTVYQLADGWDDGAIIKQDWCHVSPLWDASALWREVLFGMGVELLRQVLREAAWGPEYWPTTPGEKQDGRFATYEPLFDAARA